MSDKNNNGKDIILTESSDGVDRRGFLKCMAWAGTGLAWMVGGGVPVSSVFGASMKDKKDKKSGVTQDFSFAQISDSHIGFDKPANADVNSTLQAAIDKINGLETKPDFIIHTGDLSHLSKPAEFDALDQLLKSTGKEVFYVQGEHDMIDNGQQFLERYGKDPQGAKKKGDGWYSFDHKGVHFVGLVNVANLKAGGMGNLGHDQLEWLEDDVKGKSHSTPIVLFAHIPLLAVYPQWGWGTEDSAQALGYLKKFGSVTVLNGHIHQIMQKVEGNVTFHTAMSTAFPQPAPGTAPSPGPKKVPADKLRDVLGVTNVNYKVGSHELAVVDATLSGSAPEVNQGNTKSASASEPEAPAVAVTMVKIDNFSFNPTPVAIKPGTTVTWENGDDIPHNVESAQKKFSSPILDTNQKFQYTFKEPGEYPYFCKLHPKMTAKIVVRS